MTVNTQALHRVDQRLRKGLVPLAMLAALAQRPAHGYGLAQELHRILGASVPQGTLYPLIASFEADGLITFQWDTDTSGPARKVYKLTPQGQETLNTMAQSWRSLVANFEELVAL